MSRSGTSLAALAWRPILFVAALRLAVPVVSTLVAPIGYTPDELYYLACADRLAWGYVDHPPLSIALLDAVRSVIGDSLFALRLLPGFCESLGIVVGAMLAREFGGGRQAQLVAALAIAAAPIALLIGLPFSMNPIEHLLWPLAALVLARIVNGADPRAWLVLGVLLGFALENKLSTLWFGSSLAAGLLLSPSRTWYLTRWPWLAGAIAFAMLMPHVGWQVANDWPTVDFIRNNASAREGLDAAIVVESPAMFVASQVVLMGVFGAPVWLLGLAKLLRSSPVKDYSVFGWSFTVLFVFMMFSGRGNVYYLVGAFPIAFAAGGVAIEQLTRQLNRPIATMTCAALVLQAALAVPFLVPLVTVDQYLDIARSVRERVGADPDAASLPPTYQWMLGGPEVTEAVAEVARSLSAWERQRAGILATTFGEAGALMHLGREFDIPQVIGTHNNFWKWGPHEIDGSVLIVVADDDFNLLARFASCERKAAVDCPHCESYLHERPVFICRDLDQPLPAFWSSLKDFS